MPTRPDRRFARLLARLRRRLVGAAGGKRCPACGRAILDEDHAVHLHGDLFHAACALYRGRKAARTS